MNPCEALFLWKKIMTPDKRQYFAWHVSYLGPHRAAANGTVWDDCFIDVCTHLMGLVIFFIISDHLFLQ